MTSNRALIRVAGALTVALALGAPAACGDDDGDGGDGDGGEAASTTTAAADELCGAAEDLRQDLDSLVDVDVVSGGTDAVEERVDAIGDDLSRMREAAPDAAPDEADAFDQSLTSLGDAVSALGDGELTGESAREVVDAAGSAARAGDSYLGALGDACP